jgi:hypothetical protein
MSRATRTCSTAVCVVGAPATVAPGASAHRKASTTEVRRMSRAIDAETRATCIQARISTVDRRFAVTYLRRGAASACGYDDGAGTVLRRSGGDRWSYVAKGTCELLTGGELTRYEGVPRAAARDLRQACLTLRRARRSSAAAG